MVKSFEIFFVLNFTYQLVEHYRAIMALLSSFSHNVFYPIEEKSLYMTLCKKPMKNTREKDEMLVTSIFSFSHIVI